MCSKNRNRFSVNIGDLGSPRAWDGKENSQSNQVIGFGKAN